MSSIWDGSSRTEPYRFGTNRLRLNSVSVSVSLVCMLAMAMAMAPLWTSLPNAPDTPCVSSHAFSNSRHHHLHHHLHHHHDGISFLCFRQFKPKAQLLLRAMAPVGKAPSQEKTSIFLLFFLSLHLCISFFFFSFSFLVFVLMV